MAASARDLDLREHHGVETPEHVDVQFELAGVGSRVAAALLDLVLQAVGLVGLWIAGSAIEGDVFSSRGMARSWFGAVMILLSFCLLWGYFTLFEALNGGRTPGKQALGIRVVMDTGRSLTPTAAVVRNLVRLLDSYFPIPFVPAVLSMFLHPSNKRPGDMAAGTIVVRDHPTDWTLGAPEPAPQETSEELETGPPELSEDEFRLLDRFLGRLNDLTPEVQVRITTDLVRRFELRIPRRTTDGQAYLVAVFAEEQRKRRSRFATRAKAGAAGRVTVPAERFVQKKREGWEAFRTTALRMERSGIGALASGEIPEFAAQYREVAADLARARTYQVDPRVITYLERVVTAGHNALYRARGKERTPLLYYILRDFPASVVQSWKYVVLAFMLFAVPAGVGYVMIRERPALAEELLPPGMIARAEAAAENLTEGRGYAETGKESRPEMAAFIITNNITVSFGTFVGGITGGLLTAWLLFTNGMMLGLVMGLFQNYHALAYLLTFVLGHGVLELTAIFISAGAGFRLAQALIAPGDRTRADALIVEGRIAARMIGAVVTLLAIAGTIEGLLSASAAAPVWKYGVSAATAVFLTLYLVNGSKAATLTAPTRLGR
ncbi:MAG TPA: stage II sporulation protein M [Gemmatimonadales bacterium]|nr:stage II sporulation protein M [Gemmatimonadales bacterium]